MLYAPCKHMITIVDYNMGNLRSVSKAIEHLGEKVSLGSSPNDIAKAEKLILPGVGAFGDACAELHSLGLFQPIQTYLKSGKPFLGICLGLQLLFESSEESPEAKGLGAFKGTVKLFRSRNVKVPHMGWNHAVLKQNPILKGLANPSFFYFVHSYYAVPSDENIILGETEYGEEKFPSILGKGLIFATQFHPEKSQDSGLAILKNFVAL